MPKMKTEVVEQIKQAEGIIESRIVRFEAAVDPNTLKPNPLNPRLHPQNQRDAMKGILMEVGWVDAIKVNIQTGMIVDGHERREEAIQAGQTIPVLYVDLTPEEERLVLATFDPLAAMANYDNKALNGLLSDVTTSSESVAALLADLQIQTSPTYENKGQSGDRQIERATIARVAIHVDDVRTVERALAATGVEDRGKALLKLARYYLQKGAEES